MSSHRRVAVPESEYESTVHGAEEEEKERRTAPATPTTIGVAIRVNPATKGSGRPSAAGAPINLFPKPGNGASHAGGTKGKSIKSFARTHSFAPQSEKSSAASSPVSSSREGHVRTHCDGEYCHVTDIASGIACDRFTFDWCFDAASSSVLAISDLPDDQPPQTPPSRPGAEQEAVFESVVSPLLSDCLGNHINGCILAYGQTGSGKTYTMFGTQDHPGIVPRALRCIFDWVSAEQAAASQSPVPSTDVPNDAPHIRQPRALVRVSLVEVYLEKVTCLLSNRMVQVCERPTSAAGGSSALVLPLKVEDSTEEPRTPASKILSSQVGRSPDKPRAGKGTAAGVRVTNPAGPSIYYASPSCGNGDETMVCLGASATLDQTATVTGCYTPGARVLEVHSDKLSSTDLDGVISAVLKAVNNRHCRATAANERSSRSHVVVTLEIVQTGEVQPLSTPDGTKYVSEQNACVIRFVDLAGNERFDNGAKDDQLKETKAINKSLAALNKVLHEISRRATTAAKSNGSEASRSLLRSESLLDDTAASSVRSKSQAYSFRESVLTRLLQDCIAGNCRTTMVATVVREAPRMDSINTLRYADATRTIPSHFAGNRSCWVTTTRTIRTAPAAERKPQLQRSEHLPSPGRDEEDTPIVHRADSADLREGVRTPPTARTAKEASPNATLSEFDPAVLSMDSTLVVSDSGSDPASWSRGRADVTLPPALQNPSGPARQKSDTSDRTLSPHSPLLRHATDSWHTSKDHLGSSDDGVSALHSVGSSLHDASRLIRLDTLIAFQEALARCQETNRRLLADKAELERRCGDLREHNEKLEESRQRSLSEASDLNKIYQVVLETHKLVARGPSSNPVPGPVFADPVPSPSMPRAAEDPRASGTRQQSGQPTSSAPRNSQPQSASRLAATQRTSEKAPAGRAAGLSARRHPHQPDEVRTGGANGGSIRVSAPREEPAARTVSSINGSVSERDHKRDLVALDRRLQEAQKELSQVKAKAKADLAAAQERFLAANAEVNILHVQLQSQRPRWEEPGHPAEGRHTALSLPKWLTDYLDREAADPHRSMGESLTGMWDDDQIQVLYSLLHRLVDILKLTVLNTKTLNLHKLMELVNKVKLKQDSLLQTAVTDLRRLTDAPRGSAGLRWPLAPSEVYRLSHGELQQAASACQMLVVWHDARHDFLRSLSPSVLTELVANGNLIVHLATTAVDPSQLLFASSLSSSSNAAARRNSGGARSAASTARKEASPAAGEAVDPPLTFSRATSLQRLSRRSEELDEQAPSPTARCRPNSYHSIYDPTSHREQVLPLTEKESDAEAAAAQFGSLHSIPCVHLH